MVTASSRDPHEKSEASGRGQLAPAQTQRRRQPLRSPLDLIRVSLRRRQLLAASVVLTAAFALWSGYRHAVGPLCTPGTQLVDANTAQAPHKAVRGRSSLG